MDNIILIGTSHIAAESVNKVKSSIEAESPDIIALELDSGRLAGLVSGKKGKKIDILRHVGLTGFLFAVVGEFIQTQLGKIVDITPGKEMLTAVRLAHEKKIGIALIDQDIHTTLRRFSAIPVKEKFRLVLDLLFSPFAGKKLKFDLSKVPPQELIAEFTQVIEKRYPSIYRVLIEERNVVMARRLRFLSERHPDKKILAVVGAGHLSGLKSMLSESLPKI